MYLPQLSRIDRDARNRFHEVKYVVAIALDLRTDFKRQQNYRENFFRMQLQQGHGIPMKHLMLRLELGEEMRPKRTR
jgi:hypothetical protein